MPKISVYLSQEVFDKMKERTSQSNKSTSKYISDIITCESNDYVDITKQIEVLKRIANNINNNSNVIINSLNTYYKLFASDDTTASQFFSVDDDQHPWITKSKDYVESKIRSAKYDSIRNNSNKKY